MPINKKNSDTTKKKNPFSIVKWPRLVIFLSTIISNYNPCLELIVLLFQKEHFSNNSVENTRYSGQIPVFKVGSDARELTTRELHYYHSILSEHRYDRSNGSNRADDSGMDSVARRFRLLPRMRLNNSNESSSDDALTVRTFIGHPQHRFT